MPEVEIGGYLLEYLSEIGEARPSGNSLTSIDWQEIKAWQMMTGVKISSWDAQMLKHLSGVYVGQYHQAEDPNCPPPAMEIPSEAVLQRRLESLMKVAS